ncbi:MAG: tetratricopeptide repeat protein, partial [Myxococcota bacterium]|nr:tetratricopeptide repeat protein [Myxococcota bacterium]
APTPAASPLQAGVDEALAAAPSPQPAQARPIVPLNPSQAADFTRGVEAFEARGDDSAARSAFEAVLVSNPTAYRAAYNLGYLAERRGDSREAILNYQRALDIKPDYPVALRALFRFLHRIGRSSEGLAQVQARAQAYPDSAEMQEVLAEALIDAGRPAEGEVIARRMLIADAQSLSAFKILLRSSIAQRRDALAADLIARITTALAETVPFESCDGGGAPAVRFQCKLWAVCRFTQARTAAEQGRKFEAQQYYRDAVSADPTFVEARVLVAAYQLDIGQLDEAIDNLRAAHRLAPTWLPVLVGLGNAYRGKGLFAESLQVLREAERLYASAPEVFIGMGLLYFDARTASFEGLDRAQADQKAMDLFRRAQGLLGAASAGDTELAALIQAAQDDYNIVTAPPPAPREPTGSGSGDDWGGGGAGAGAGAGGGESDMGGGGW